MILKVNKNSCIVFDLDDTLYPEIDYLKSAYHEISVIMDPDMCKSLYGNMIEIYYSGGNTFQFLLEKFPEKHMTLEKLLYLYRNHYPGIALREGVLEILIKIREKGGKTGIISDGRSITQRNKIKALGLENLIDKIVISEEFGCEKPDQLLYDYFIEEGVEKEYFYFGDNFLKDFITPKRLGWCCIGLVDGCNIYNQKLSDFSKDQLPHFYINKFTEIEIR